MTPNRPKLDPGARPTLADVVEALNNAAEVLGSVDRKLRANRLGLIALAMVVLLGFGNYSIQRNADCDRANDVRASIRVGIVGTIERFTPPDQTSIAPDVDEYLAGLFPRRDCSGLFP